MVLAGTPPIMQIEGKLFVTTAPEAKIKLSSRITSGQIVTLTPIHIVFLIFTGSGFIGNSIIFTFENIPWFAIMINSYSAIITLAPLTNSAIVLKCDARPIPELSLIEILFILQFMHDYGY